MFKILISSGIALSLSLSGYLGYKLSELDKKFNNDFYVYDSGVVDSSIKKTLRKKLNQTPKIYEMELSSKYKTLSLFLKRKTTEKPVYALGARIGGIDITDDVISFLNVEKRYPSDVSFSLPADKAIEKAKNELIKIIDSRNNVSNSDSIVP